MGKKPVVGVVGLVWVGLSLAGAIGCNCCGSRGHQARNPISSGAMSSAKTGQGSSAGRPRGWQGEPSRGLAAGQTDQAIQVGSGAPTGSSMSQQEIASQGAGSLPTIQPSTSRSLPGGATVQPVGRGEEALPGRSLVDPNAFRSGITPTSGSDPQMIPGSTPTSGMAMPAERNRGELRSLDSLPPQPGSAMGGTSTVLPPTPPIDYSRQPSTPSLPDYPPTSQGTIHTVPGSTSMPSDGLGGTPSSSMKPDSMQTLDTGYPTQPAPTSPNALPMESMPTYPSTLPPAGGGTLPPVGGDR